jgi:hypothetical protein
VLKVFKEMVQKVGGQGISRAGDARHLLVHIGRPTHPAWLTRTASLYMPAPILP